MEKRAEIRAFHPSGDPTDGPNVDRRTLEALVDLSADGMCLVDPSGWHIFYANSALRHWAGQSAGPTSEWKLSDFLPRDHAAAVFEWLARLAAGEESVATFSSRVATQVGGESVAEFTARRVEMDGRRLLAIVVRRAPSPVAALRAGQQIDPLTGLADRSFLMDRLMSLVEGERSGDRRCAILFVDVDGFKQVNDSHGHLVGDRVLCEVATRLAGCVRSDDRVARYGGDEFVVLLENVSGPQEIRPVVDRISAAFARPIELPEGSVALTVSVGVAEAKPHGQTVEGLLAAADRAMYAAKRAAM